ncbi:MAG: AMP-binding protein [Chloroflexota bacterium]
MPAQDAAAAGAQRLTQSYWPADTSEPLLETTVGDALRLSAARWPTRDALVFGTPDPTTRRRWTFAALLADAERVARTLLGRFQPGEHVAVWAPNCPEWVLLEFGAALAGLTLVTVNPAYLAAELTYVLRQSQAVGLFVAPEYRGRSLLTVAQEAGGDLPLLREVVSLADWNAFVEVGDLHQALPRVSPDDVAQIQYTSGTTGFPKGALLHHRGLTNNGRLYARRIGGSASDVWLNVMPLFHTAGCVLVTLGALQVGATHVLLPGFDPGLMLELAETERATNFGGVPTMLVALLEHPDFGRRDLSSLRSVGTGGAPVPVELMRRIEATLGVPVNIGYGQTEASPYITHTRLDDDEADRLGTVGRPLPQTEVKIVDPATGETVPTGTVGEVCTRGYLVMRGYFDDPEATAAAIDDDGWLHTGDLGLMDARGYCRIEGRLKEMIIQGGENIYPREIEAVLFAHPAVGDVAVVGIPDQRWGEVVAAFVRPAPGETPTEADLFAYCRQQLASYKTPRLWRFVEQFPQTASGKIQKFVLREQVVRELRLGE